MSSSSSSTCSPARLGRRRSPVGLVCAALLFVAIAAASPQLALVNPSIPSQERIVYDESLGEKRGLVTEELRLVEEGGRRYYELREESEKVSALFRIDAESLLTLSSSITTRGERSVVRRSMELLEVKPGLGPDELAVSDPASLAFALRGFPWGSRRSARLVFLGGSGGGTEGGGQGLGFELTVQGRETLQLDGGSYPCWKAQLGLGGALGGLMPKTYLWFLDAAPHYLVRYEGPSGGPGSPKRLLTLREYRAGATGEK